MTILQARNLTVTAGARSILEKLSFSLASGDHIGLVGRNGGGKSTLLGVLGGELPAAGEDLQWNGRLTWPGQEPRVALLHQEPPGALMEQVASEVIRGGGPAAPLATELDKLQARMASGETSEHLLDHYGEVLEDFERLGGFQLEASVKKAAASCGVSQEMMNRQLRGLSGGERTKVRLARLLVQEPDLLLLDEPANHLDQEARQWLASWIDGFQGAVLMASHDRWLLDQTVHTTWEIERGTLTTYAGNYSFYREQKRQELERQWQEYQQWQKERKALKDAMNRQKQWAQQAHQVGSKDVENKAEIPFLRRQAMKIARGAQAKSKRLERLLEDQRAEKPWQFREMDVDLPQPPSSSGQMVLLQDAVLKVGNRCLWRARSLALEQGDHLAIRGRNGSGKTLLCNLIAARGEVQVGEVQTEGEWFVSQACSIGYYRQDLDSLTATATLLEEMTAITPDEQTARTYLGCFLFPQDRVYQKVQDLSPGERARLQLAKVIFSAPQLLILDEPENHLDVDTLERVEELLEGYAGALLVVTHDRQLADRLTERTWHIHGGEIETT